MIYNADCLTILPTLEENAYHSLVTDPPSGIEFMSLKWDANKGGKANWIAWLSSVMRECLRVLRPGGHALIWALPRTSHWTMNAVEDSGFEIRDCVYWLQAQGFPKGQDISKAIDKTLGAERQKILVPTKKGNRKIDKGEQVNTYSTDTHAGYRDVSNPATCDGRKWRGWNTCLKPAVELWILARKPLSEKSIAANVLKWGCGGINVEGCKVGNERHWSCHDKKQKTCYGNFPKQDEGVWKEGRHPANLICSDPDLLGEHAKFFYCPKASRSERAGNTHPTVKPVALMSYLCRLITPPNGTVLDPFCGSGSTGVAALQEGFSFVGIEQEPSYYKIAVARIGETT